MEAHCENKDLSENKDLGPDSPISRQTEEERQEREHFIRIINAFKYYRFTSLSLEFK